MMDKIELSLGEWVKIAQPNDFFIYATVRHLTDSYISRKIGTEAWKLAVKGEVYLVQRRVQHTTPSMFDYIVIKAGISPVRSLITSDYGDPISLEYKYREAKTKPMEQLNG